MTAVKYVSWITTCTVFTAFISVLLQAYWASQHLTKLTTVLTGLIALEHANSSAILTNPRIAVGYGSCSDLYVRATQFLNYSNLQSPIGDDFTFDDINSENELLRSFGYYFQRGAAAERFTSNQTLFRNLIASSKLKDTGNNRWALGGNAPVMGTRFLKEGAVVLLAAQMSKELRRSIPDGIQITGYPIDYDDIHLIMEYKTDERWGPFTASRANRYILHNDQENPTISSMAFLEESLPAFNARLLVVSGLQMLDSYPFAPGVREMLFFRLQEQISSQPISTLIHFEMASFVEMKLMHLLINTVIPYSDSIGMNEQELDNLAEVLDKEEVKFSSESNPRVATALTQMRYVFRTINTKYFLNTVEDAHRRMLTRIHVHTLAYQAILVVKDSQWKNTKNAAAKATLTAHRHVCATNIINPEASNLILDDSFSTSTNHDENTNAPKRINFKIDDPVSCWSEQMTVHTEVVEFEICVAPVLVCKVAKQTVGAGDNISAAGLVLQL